MPEYLQQDLMNQRGYVAKPGRPKTTEAAVALTADGKVIFGDPKTPRATYAKPNSKLMAYDDEVERQRRLVCDTALGQLMLDNPKFALPALNQVNQGISQYWQQLKNKLSTLDGFKKVVTLDGKYAANPTSFGRLNANTGEAQPQDILHFKAEVDNWVKVLGNKDLPKIMSLHDVFLRIYCRNELKDTSPRQKSVQLGYREAWYDDKALRGRDDNAKDSYQTTAMPGLITQDFTIPFGDSLNRSGINFNTMRLEERTRGTDRFKISAQAMKPEFRSILGDNNLIFAASASGTTSTLLSSAKVFKPTLFASAESKKQYLMGCLAYLVGGGMHTSHEVFYTGGLAGLDYTPGKYLSMLPETFTSSRLFEHWSSEFWELVRPDRPSPR